MALDQSPEAAPDTPTYIELTYKAGDIVAIDGKELSPATVLAELNRIGGMFGLYFADACPGTYDAVLACDKEAFNRFFHAMIAAGHYFAPSAFEAGFVSAAHSDADIAGTIASADAYFASLK